MVHTSLSHHRIGLYNVVAVVVVNFLILCRVLQIVSSRPRWSFANTHVSDDGNWHLR